MDTTAREGASFHDPVEEAFSQRVYVSLLLLLRPVSAQRWSPFTLHAFTMPASARTSSRAATLSEIPSAAASSQLPARPLRNTP